MGREGCGATADSGEVVGSVQGALGSGGHSRGGGAGAREAGTDRSRLGPAGGEIGAQGWDRGRSGRRTGPNGIGWDAARTRPPQAWRLAGALGGTQWGMASGTSGAGR